MKVLLILFFCSYFFYSTSQGSIVQHGAEIVNTSGTNIYARGSIILLDNTVAKNRGKIYLEGDWENNSTTSGIDTLFGNGEVILDGATQQIKGTNETYFYDLSCSGVDEKSAEINFFIRNKLDLKSAVLEVNQYQVHLTNPVVNSLLWNKGYIQSSNISGYFLRSTNTTNVYQFPTGGSSLSNNYRGVEITPTTSDSSIFGVRMAEQNASFETGVSAAGSQAPFDLSSKEIELDHLNQNYYWAIHKFYGDAEAQANFYGFQSDAENDFITFSKWSSNDGLWKRVNYSLSTPSTIKSEFATPDIVATSNGTLTYEDDIYVFSEINLKFPQVFTPFPEDGFNDKLVIENLDLFPNNSIQIYNRWGEQVFQASPYNNDWGGENNSSVIKLQGKELEEDTYFYILDLGNGQDPIKKYIELIKN